MGPPSLDVLRSLGSSVPQLVAVSHRVRRSVMTKPRPLSRTPLRNSVLLNPSVPASTSPSLSPSSPPPRSVLMSPRRCAPGPEPTQGRSRSQLSRNGAMCLLRSLAWLKSAQHLGCLSIFTQKFQTTYFDILIYNLQSGK